MSEEVFVEVSRQSFLAWVFSALGVKYVVLLTLSALLAFVLTLIVVVWGRGWAAGVALWFTVPLPLVVGVFGVFDGTMMYYTVIARSTVTPHPSELAAGISTAIVVPMVGLLLMAPSYLLAMCGLIIRSLVAASTGQASRS